MLERVPDQAKLHIEHAMEVSRRGHDRALGALAAAAARHQNPGQQAVIFLKAADRRAAQAQIASGPRRRCGRSTRSRELRWACPVSVDSFSFEFFN